MKARCVMGLLITATVVLGSAYDIAPVAAQSLAGSSLKVLSANLQEIVLELTVTGFEVEMIEHYGQTFQRLVIPEMVQTDVPGNPQVPTYGALLGLPATEGISVQILEADYDTLNGYNLYPSPVIEPSDGIQTASSQPVFAPNQAVYTADAFYPDQPVKIGQTGKIRDQAVGQVQFYPAQYNPVSGEIRLYRRLVVRITWSERSGASSSTHSTASRAFEKVLQRTVLNYDSLERPPIVASSSSPAASGVDLGAAAGGQALKIGVTEDGIYQLIPSDLTGAGFDLNGVALSTIKIKNKGAETRIFTRDDNGNDAFDGGDYILFYGTAITDIYTTKNVYWLEGGGADGLRMATRDGTLGGGTIPAHFPITFHAEEDSFYWTMPGGDSQEDRWFWGERIGFNVSGLDTFRDLPVDLGNLSTVGGTTATIRVRMKGVTAGPHRTKILINGLEVDDQDWGASGQLIYDQEKSDLQANLNLQNGANTIRVRPQNYPGQQLFVNWLELDFWRAYVARNNELLFGAPSAGTFQFEVTNFNSGAFVQVFDITNPANVATFMNTTVAGGKLQFKDTAQTESRYLALTPARRKSPASIDLDQPSDWQNTNNQADYIIITYKDFYASTLTLANHRTNFSGLNVVTVKIGDVFDEFNHGIYNPQAIRDFLSHAYHHWKKPAPTYVLLVSGATYDYRNLLYLSRVNYVPTHFTITDELGATPSDNWFVAVDGVDVLPDMFIGRLTAQTSVQVDDMVDKIISYDLNPPDTSWNTDVLLVADDGNPPDDNDSTFEDISQALIDRLPGNYTANKVYLNAGQPDPPDPTGDIVDHINSGSLLVNYAGHGNLNFWAQEKILRPSHIVGLSNTNKLSVVTVANCLNGYFVDDKDTSMAETFLDRPSKGAAAVWADTSLGFPSGHELLLTSFYEAIFQDDKFALGAAATAAKFEAFAVSSFWAEMVETFVLFGDPAMELGLPTRPFVESTTPANGAGFVAVDQSIDIVFSKPVNPAETSLKGPGTIGSVFTPTWASGNRVVSYDHTDFTIGETLVFTIEGQDTLGNALGPGPVPTTWSFTVGIGHIYLPIILRE